MIRQVVSRALYYGKPESIWKAQRMLISAVRYTSVVPVNRSIYKNCLASKKSFSTEAAWTDAQLDEVVKKDNIVVFMKGTPDAPQCGFSKYVVQIFTMHGCENLKTFNVLEDDTLRSRVKEFSNWPTIPQVYMKGEFLGGFDILLQMHQSGDLIEELEKIGHRSALIDADQPSE